MTVYRSTQIFRSFLYDYREQLTASVIVAGWDEVEGGQVSDTCGMFTVCRSTLSPWAAS